MASTNSMVVSNFFAFLLRTIFLAILRLNLSSPYFQIVSAKSFSLQMFTISLAVRSSDSIPDFMVIKSGSSFWKENPLPDSSIRSDCVGQIFFAPNVYNFFGRKVVRFYSRFHGHQKRLVFLERKSPAGFVNLRRADSDVKKRSVYFFNF